MRPAVLALVLAVLSNFEELLDRLGGDRVVADEFVEVAGISAQVLPGKNLLAGLSVFDTQVQGLIEKESLLVALGSKSVNLGVLAFFLG